MSTQLSPSAYKQAIDEDLEALYKHMPDILERWHIEDVLKYSIQHFYPGFVDTQAHTKELREENERLQQTIDAALSIYRLGGENWELAMVMVLMGKDPETEEL